MYKLVTQFGACHLVPRPSNPPSGFRVVLKTVRGSVLWPQGCRMLALFYTLSEGVVGIGTPLAPQLVTSTWAAISNPDLVRSNWCTCISLTNCNSGNCVFNRHILVLYTTILDIVMVPHLNLFVFTILPTYLCRSFSHS